MRLQTIPGLLRAEEYARAVLSCGTPSIGIDKVENQLAARMRRQGIFEREQPPFMRAVVDGIVVRRPIGGRAVLKRQLEHLVEVARRPYVTFVTVPGEVGEHAALDGSFGILTFIEDEPLLYAEGRRAAAMANLRQGVAPVLQSFMTLCAQGLSPRASSELLAAIMGEL